MARNRGRENELETRSTPVVRFLPDAFSSDIQLGEKIGDFENDQQSHRIPSRKPATC